MPSSSQDIDSIEDENKSGIAAQWHAISVEDAFDKVKSTAEGLTGDEAGQRLLVYGPNRLSPLKRRGPLARFASQFNNVLIYVLLGASAITVVLGHWVDAGVIVGVVFLNAVIGFIQEGKAEKALDAIKGMLSPNALIMRDGKRLTLPAERIVPGDTVFLQSGDKVPADLRLFRVKELRMDEATLTGESVPVGKFTEAVDNMATVGDRKCMAYSGTLVTYGQGTGMVVATGDSTELGRINAMLAHVQPLTTRLLVQMAEFGRVLTFAILAAAASTFAFGMLVRGYSAGEMFLAAVGLAVAAIPEGLPAIITITLAIGVQRMARRKAIIRRLPAVETLGSVTVICSDKTGTLTKNEMTVQTVTTSRFTFDVSGAGYDPHGGFSLAGAEVAIKDYPVFVELARVAMLCNDSTLSEVDGRWQVNGDPTEGALLTFGIKSGMDPAVENNKFPRVDTIPFESEHRFMATLHHDHADHCFIYIKGAPERVLEMSNRQIWLGEDEPIDRVLWNEKIREIAARGQRLLAVAFRAEESRKRELSFRDVEGGFTLLGIFGIIDPPSEEAIAAVARCRSAGIRVKMITGDHAITARTIGAQMGIGDGETVITGREVEEMDDIGIQAAARRSDVFARVSPEHKLRLVQALQAAGEVVAMTGDGVNDAPALKRADVGVAMGIKGTEVSKEAAEMVLADDNFVSIASAVEEGRTVYDNIKKAIIFILPTNAAEAGIIIAAILSGRMLPITPVQILWVNMITAVTLALALAFEPPESDVMKRTPRDPKEPIISAFLIWRILFVATVVVIATFGLFLWDRLHGASIEVARTAAVNTIIFFEVFYLMNTRYLRSSVLNMKGLLGNRLALGAIGAVVVIQVFFTYAPPMQHLFGTAPLSAAEWARIIIVSSSVLFLVEIEKFVLMRSYPGNGSVKSV